jgi:hypothetical protein
MATPYNINAKAPLSAGEYADLMDRNATDLAVAKEREACAELVQKMADEVGGSNLLYAVALAIKSRRDD